MTKEKILESIKDLVLTLKSSNLKEPKVQGLWREKQKEVHEALKVLSVSDLKWLDTQYKEWYKREVLPYLDAGIAELAESEDFPWI
jgi:hypothetical protein